MLKQLMYEKCFNLKDKLNFNIPKIRIGLITIFGNFIANAIFRKCNHNWPIGIEWKLSCQLKYLSQEKLRGDSMNSIIIEY